MKIEIKHRQTVTRIIWNTTDWVRPSGANGKSDDDTSDNGGAGFGYEEWLLSPYFNRNGIQFGFLKGVDRREKDQGDHTQYDRIYLFTREANSKQDFYAGYIDNVTLLGIQKKHEVVSEILTSDLIDIMNEQLQSVGIQESIDNKWIKERGINISFHSEDLHLIDSDLMPKIVETSKKDGDFTLGRYSLYKSLQYFITEDIEHSGMKNNLDHTYPPPQKEYKEPQSRSFTQDRRLHDIIQRKLHARLVSEVSDLTTTFVHWEHPIKNTRLKADIALVDKNGIHLFEVKTYSSLRKCIRAAVGQLLEYHAWIREARAQSLTIVSHFASNREVDAYLDTLSQMFGIRVSYRQVSTE